MQLVSPIGGREDDVHFASSHDSTKGDRPLSRFDYVKGESSGDGGTGSSSTCTCQTRASLPRRNPHPPAFRPLHGFKDLQWVMQPSVSWGCCFNASGQHTAAETLTPRGKSEDDGSNTESEVGSS